MPTTPDLGRPYHWQPAAAGGEIPPITLVLLHDDGGDEHSLMGLGASVAPGAGLLAPRRDPTDDPHHDAAELAAFLSDAVAAFELDAGALWGLGFGAGATALTGLAVDHPDALAALIVLSGRAPFPAPGGRILEAKKTFCATGTEDESVSGAAYEELVELLVTAGAEVQLHWYECGHEVVPAEVDDVARFVARWAVAADPGLSGPGTG
ncbi:MAG: alpha/beta hydrolase [Acidimicrobiales bacterium]